jgi:hypothetical protein
MPRTRTGHTRPLHLRGIVLPDGVERDLFVTNGRITFVPQEDARTMLDGGYLLPGLVDAHAHLGPASPAGSDALPDERSGCAPAPTPISRRACWSCASRAGRITPSRASARMKGCLAPPSHYFPGLAREVTERALPDVAEEARRAAHG